ncbi:hypothetical protein TrCOL_g11773 [Triparma columacea]|uniref:Uncharacterized protein n=1 Tax=Triparma columacea TaxID=722753 RepID=A0A9W7FXX2_9STRA|nr:hypothetical protein TrCOL_g11773 [Triparma columacea]
MLTNITNTIIAITADSENDNEDAGQDSKSFSDLIKQLDDSKEDENGYVEAFEEIVSKVIIHEKPSVVADYLIENKSNGALRRYTLDTKDNTTIALWQHHLKRGKIVVQYLLEICSIENQKIFGTKKECSVFTLNTIDNDTQLSEKAFAKYTELASLRSNCVQAHLKMGTIKLEECELGQSILTMQGELSLDHGSSKAPVRDGPGRNLSSKAGEQAFD